MVRIQLYPETELRTRLKEIGHGSPSLGAKTLIVIKLAEANGEPRRMKEAETMIHRTKFRRMEGETNGSIQLYFDDGLFRELLDVGCGSARLGAQALMLMKLAEMDKNPQLEKEAEDLIRRAKFRRMRKEE